MPKLVLYPLSAFYGIVVYFRNRLYDMKIFRSEEFIVPVISVGNITVGGTGKTPHIEYLVSLLMEKFSVATLSRGYKRKTSGFRMVGTGSTVSEAGDEPVQIKNKFPGATVAVCENRVTGVKKLLAAEKIPDVVLLDDAFQHRRITPGINILLVDYNRPISDDLLLPAGRLREGSIQIRRANVIIITKCPQELTPIKRRILQKNVALKPYQSIYFTTIVYGNLLPVFREMNSPALAGFKDYAILLVTGIASNTGLLSYLQKFSNQVFPIEFPDHYSYSEKDVESIVEKYREIVADRKIILTTEKDAVRFRALPEINPEYKSLFYYLPIQIKFLEDQGTLFNQKILNYVGENKSNLSLHQRKTAANS